MSKLTLGIPWLTLAMLSTAGCSHTWRYAIDDQLKNIRPDSREITASAQYGLFAGDRIKTVAVQAPTECASEGAASATGGANEREKRTTVLETRCGVEMAEVERALTRAGYVVISWQNLHAAFGERADKSENYVVVARRLGAQVLFNVNSLERVHVTVGEDASWDRHFARDEENAKDADKPIPEKDTMRLRALIEPSEKQIADGNRLGAMLDLTAVAVETSQSFWFYRGVHMEEVGTPKIKRVVMHKGDLWSFDAAASADPGDNAGTDHEHASAGSADAERQEDARYFKLVREVVGDFVTNFRKGPGPPPPPPPPVASTPPPPPPPPPPPTKDVVELADGSQLQGKIVDLKRGKSVTLEVAPGARTTIQWAQVKNVVQAPPAPAGAPAASATPATPAK